jgi:hypothetical protein
MSKQRFINRKLAKQAGFGQRQAKEKQRGARSRSEGRAIIKLSSRKH